MRNKLPAISMLILSLAGCDLMTTRVPPDPERNAVDDPTMQKSQPSANVSGVEETRSPSRVTLQVLDFAGVEQLIASKRGQVIVLDCWSTSCQPCRKAFPNLVALSREHREQLACVSLSFDYEGIGKPEDQREKVLTFLREQGATFDNVLCSLESDLLSEKLDIPSIPAVFVYDRAGKLRKKFDNRNASKVGPFNYEQVQAFAEELLQEKG